MGLDGLHQVHFYFPDLANVAIVAKPPLLPPPPPPQQSPEGKEVYSLLLACTVVLD
jgi:hypothetical protein